MCKDHLITCTVVGSDLITVRNIIVSPSRLPLHVHVLGYPLLSNLCCAMSNCLSYIMLESKHVQTHQLGLSQQNDSDTTKQSHTTIAIKYLTHPWLQCLTYIQDQPCPQAEKWAQCTQTSMYALEYLVSVNFRKIVCTLLHNTWRFTSNE